MYLWRLLSELVGAGHDLVAAKHRAPGSIHRFHFIVAEQVLRTRVGDADVMIGQLEASRVSCTLGYV